MSFAVINEPPFGKTNNVVSEQARHKPSCTSTEDGYRLEMDLKCRENCTIRVAKTNALISFAVTATAKLICAFDFAYADCRFFHEAAQIS